MSVTVLAGAVEPMGDLTNLPPPTLYRTDARGCCRGKALTMRSIVPCPDRQPVNPGSPHRVAPAPPGSPSPSPHQAMLKKGAMRMHRSQSGTARALPRLRRDQRRIGAHPARFKVVVCGRRWGKTTLAVSLAVRYAENGLRVWWVTPIYQLAYYAWLDFKRRFAVRWESKTEHNFNLELPNGGSITIKSADNPDGLRGVGVDLLIVDEAAFISEEVCYECLRPALSDRQGSAILISTPSGRNWFHQAYVLGQDPAEPEWMSWRFPTSRNKNIPEAEIAEARRLLSERVFRQEYEAEFLEDGGAVFRGLKRSAVAPLDAQPIPGHRYVMGVDFGRYEDFTACVVIDADQRQMVALDRFNEVEWSLERARIAALARKWNIYAILAESNAMGEPNIEALYREGLPVNRFYTTARSKPELVEGLVAVLETGELRIMPDPVLLGELESYTYRLMPSSHTEYGAPPGRHDDTVIALALAWKQAATPRIALAIAVV